MPKCLGFRAFVFLGVGFRTKISNVRLSGLAAHFGFVGQRYDFSVREDCQSRGRVVGVGPYTRPGSSYVVDSYPSTKFVTSCLGESRYTPNIIVP